MARLETAVVVTFLALALGGCSAATSASGAGSATPGASEAAPAASSAPAGQGGGASIDCTVMAGGTAATYVVGIQMLAQLRSQGAVDLVKDGTAVYDPDAMDAILTNLKGLAGHGVPGLGDPGPDVDFYLTANSKAKAILAVSGPVPQSMFDDLVSFEGDVGTFITRQASINAALSAACP